MFKKLLNSLKKCFTKNTPENKDVRGLCESSTDEHKSDTMESKKANKGENKKMEDEKIEKKVETSTKTDENTENNGKKVDETTEKVEKTDEKVEKSDDTTNSKEETTQTDNNDGQEQPPQVEQTETTGNGVALDDLVTKEQLMDALKAFEAKFDAVIKENVDLKDKLSNSQKETNELRDKYENKDFGNFQRQGMLEKDKQANETFDEYSKQFM